MKNTLKRKDLLLLGLLLTQTTLAWGMEPKCDERSGAHYPAQSLPRGNLEQEQKALVLGHLKSFGLPPQKIENMWQEFNGIRTAQGQLHPFCLASQEPYFIAFGLLRADQEMTTQQQTNQTAFSLTSMLSCLLTKEFSSINKKISLSDAQLLAKLIQSNPYFRALELFKAGITDTHLSVMGIMHPLQEFSLEENEITDSGIETLMHYPKLQKLNLAKNKITPQGVVLLAKSPHLKHLNLYKNPTGDVAAKILAHNKVLTYLDLRATEVGDRGAQALGMYNTTLRDLRLRHNKITDVGAEAFLKCHHLTHLELARNQIKPELVFFLENLMPSNGYLNKLREPQRVTRPALPAQKDCVRILSIDEDSIKGIVPSEMLKYVEETLTQKAGSQFHFAQHIDLMAGGIISLGLTMPGEGGRPKYTTETLVDLYKTKGKEMFPAPFGLSKDISTHSYSSEAREQYLSSYFKDTYLSESLCPTLVTSFNLNSNESHVFDSLEAKADEAKNFHIKEVGRATSATSTHFPCAKIKNKRNEEFEFVDGGIYASNPTLLAIQRAQQLYPNAKEYTVYSFGTGCAPKKYLSDFKDNEALKWDDNIAGILMENAAAYTEDLIDQEIKKDHRIKYIRIQPQLQASEKEANTVGLDNMDNLLKTVKNTIIKEKQTLDGIIEEFYKDFGI